MMILLPVNTHSPSEPTEENDLTTPNDALRWFFFNPHRFIWTRLMLYSYNNKVLIDLEDHIQYLQQSATESQFPGLNENERNAYIKNGFCTLMCEEATRINTYMAKAYESLCGAMGIKDPAPLNVWSFFSQVPSHDKISMEGLSVMLPFRSLWETEYELPYLVGELNAILKQIKKEKEERSTDYSKLSSEDLVELIIVRLYAKSPELLREYETIIRLVLKAKQ